MGQIAIACYRPKPGQQAALEALARTHVPRLRALSLVTAREPVLMRAADGTVIEVFEWTSEQAIADAHEHPEVQVLWEEFGRLCDFLPLAQLPEASELFGGFEPL